MSVFMQFQSAEKSEGLLGKKLYFLTLSLVWVACVVTALGVVSSGFQSRQAMQSLEVLRREADRMQVMTGQYMLERSSWAAYSRIEKIAKKELKMVPPESAKTVLVYRK